ncbi:Peroxidase 56-like protein [Drosera capensis]
MAYKSRQLGSSLVFILMLLGFVILAIDAKGLKLHFYKHSCPQAEKIVKEVTAKYVMQDPTVSAPLLRLTFHDCFVRGCDASVLLEPTKGNNATEKTYPPNLTLGGFYVIDAIKSALEEKCPGVVSCADIIQLAGRDAASGPSWKVLTGRRDGTISLASEAAIYLPSPYDNITVLKQKFEAVTLSVYDLVVLSAAHTIGASHCASFSERLYNFSRSSGTDPSLNPHYAKWLKKECLKNYNTSTTVNLDPITPNKFDSMYYLAVSQHRGLFESDAALLEDKRTADYVRSQVKNNGATFMADFGKSMANMYKLKVLTGTEGEIRKRCGYVNS